MPDAQNDNLLSLHPIPQYIRPNDRHFARTAGRLATTIGKLGKTIRRFDQTPAQPVGGRRVERRDISDDRFQMRDRFVCPDDLAQINRRRVDAAAVSPIPTIRSTASRRHG